MRLSADGRPAPGGSETGVELPLRGIGSSDPAKVRKPLVRPLWLIFLALAVIAGLFVWIRLRFLQGL